MQTSDPVVRYTAAAILLSAFFASLAVAIHGYWTVNDYAPPPFIVALLTSGVVSSAAALGLHFGAASTITAVNTGASTAQAAHNGVKETA